MGPIIPVHGISQELKLLIAFLIGLGVGFALEQAGFSSSRKLAGMFYGYDITVLKVFFTAAITAMIGMIFMNFAEMIDMSIVYVNQYYIQSAIVGGVIMGAGFIVGGFCPSTSVCAAAIGKVDAMVFIGGSLVGILLFGEGYALWEKLYTSTYVGAPKLSDVLNVKDGLLGLGVVAMAMFMFWLGEKAEQKFKRDDITNEI